MNLTGKGGFQERKQHINRKGRPRSFNQIRALAQSIAHEKITDANGEVMTRVECILRDWSESKDVQKQIAFVQYGYGKPVGRVELDELKPVLRLYYAHERPDLPPPDESINAVNGEGTRRPLLSGAARPAVFRYGLSAISQSVPQLPRR